MIGPLPFVMIAILFTVNPHYASVLFTTGLGRVMLGAATTSMGIGFFVISRMIKFEI